MKEKAPLIKFILSTILLFISAAALSSHITTFINEGNYFLLDVRFSLITILLMLLTLYIFSVTSSAETQTWQNIISSLVIPAALGIPLFNLNITYMGIVIVLSFVIIAYNTHKVTWLKNMLIKFKPRIILRFSARGVLLVFSIFASILVLLSSSGITKIDIGNKIAEIAEKPVKDAVEKQVQMQLESQAIELSGSDVDISEILKNIGVSDGAASNLVSPENIDVKDIVANQVNSFLEPYKNFLVPIIAVLIFALFQFYAGIAYFLFTITIDLLFKLLEKTGFLRIEITTVQKEELKF